MKRFIRANFALFPVLGLLAGSGCYRNQYRTLVLNVPQMKTEACGLALRDRLMAFNERSEGRELIFHKDVRVDAGAKTLTVVYNSGVTAGVNVLQNVAAMGYDATDAANPARTVRGDPAARKKLPPDCQ